MDTTLPIGLRKGRLDAEPHILAQFLGGTAEGSRLAKEDAVVGDAGFFRANPRNRTERGEQGDHTPHLFLRLIRVR